MQTTSPRTHHSFAEPWNLTRGKAHHFSDGHAEASQHCSDVQPHALCKSFSSNLVEIGGGPDKPVRSRFKGQQG